MGSSRAAGREFQLRKMKLWVLLSAGPELTLPTPRLSGRAALTQSCGSVPTPPRDKICSVSAQSFPHPHPACFLLAVSALPNFQSPPRRRVASLAGAQKGDLKIQFSKNNRRKILPKRPTLVWELLEGEQSWDAASTRSSPHPWRDGIGAFLLWTYFGKSRRETVTKADMEQRAAGICLCQADKARRCQPAPPQLPEQVGTP